MRLNLRSDEHVDPSSLMLSEYNSEKIASDKYQRDSFCMQMVIKASEKSIFNNDTTAINRLRAVNVNYDGLSRFNRGQQEKKCFLVVLVLIQIIVIIDKL